mgnify:FL=1
MSLAQAVIDGVIKAQAALGNLVIDAVLKTNPASNYNVTTGNNEVSYTDTNIKATVVNWEFKEIDGNSVREDDVKLLVFNTDGLLNINENDKITMSSEVFNVKRVKKERVGIYSPVLIVQLRK